MRKTGLIDALFPKVRQQILATLLPDAERSWYLRDLAQHLEVTPSSLQRELASLVEAGILAKRQDGNRTYFQAATRCPIFPELRSIFIKTSGLADRVRSALEPISGRIDLAFIFGSMADSTERSWSDVDLFVVGQVKMSDLTRALKPLETSLGRSVNPLLYSGDEFRAKIQEGRHLVSSVVDGRKMFIIGTDSDLGRIIKGGAG